MKMNKKKVFTLALAVCLIAILSMGSLAWFSDSDEVTNDFMVAGSENNDPDEIFSVDVWEEVDPDGDGVTEKTDEGADYEDILPGDELVKIAHVENTGSYDQYIRVTIEISDASAWQSALGADFNDQTLLEVFGGFDQSAWSEITTAVVDNKIQIVMYYNYILTVDEVITVFTTVNVPESLTQEQVVAFNSDGTNGFSVHVVADAVQTENLGIDTTNDVCDAYEAFQVVMP